MERFIRPAPAEGEGLQEEAPFSLGDEEHQRDELGRSEVFQELQHGVFIAGPGAFNTGRFRARHGEGPDFTRQGGAARQGGLQGRGLQHAEQLREG
eukprot:5578438-Alexandrium_andersonii.AAC.1